MAGIKPGFLTGATAKIKLGGKTMGYAQDVTYVVDVQTIPIEVLGRYEVVTNEPIGYFVSGSLSIIRYTSIAKDMAGAAATGNGIGAWNAAGADVRQIDPGQIMTSETFDMEVFQKQTAGGLGDDPLVLKIRDCRFTRMGAGVSRRGVMVQTFSFNAILWEDDSFQATRSSGEQDLA